MSFWRKRALFSPRAVGSQQKQQNEIHSAEDRRWRDKGKISDVLQCAKCKPTGILQLSEE